MKAIFTIEEQDALAEPPTRTTSATVTAVVVLQRRLSSNSLISSDGEY